MRRIKIYLILMLMGFLAFACNPVVITPKISQSFVATGTATITRVFTQTYTPTWTPTGSYTYTPTLSPTPTFTFTLTPTFTPAFTFTATFTPPPMDGGCTQDNLTGIGSSGTYGVGYPTSIVPLCNGWVLAAESNRVQAFNVVYQTLGASYPLSSPPGDMAYDPSTQTLWVILANLPTVAKINVGTGVISYVTLTGDGAHLAAAANGCAFVSLQASTYVVVNYINGTGSVAGSVTISDIFVNAFIACNSAGTTLYAGPQALVGGYTGEYSFNTTTFALGLIALVDGYSQNGQEMELSSDGNHLAYPNGGGNGPGYSIYDLMGSNINSNYGAWVTGPYPTSAGFSPDSANFVATNGTDLQVFSVATHAVSKPTWTGVGNLKVTRFSLGGGLVYGLQTPGTIFWETFP